LAIEVDGQNYEVTLGSEQDLPQKQAALPSGSKAQGGQHSPPQPGDSLVPTHSWQQQEHRLALPEVTLTGPVELVLSEPQVVSLYTPHAADVGVVSRIAVAAGATVRVVNMKAITLRRPVNLPRLPGQYLAEVYAQAKLGEPEAGFHYAPGILYMSKLLREAALNSSSGLPLLSFEVEAAQPGMLTVMSAGELADDVAPRLKVKKGRDGLVELSARPGQITEPRFNLHALTHVWAWPLPHLEMSSWVPYESLLRSLLASHPFDIGKVVSSGVGLKLTKSSIRGVRMMAFEMHVRSRVHTELPEGAPFPSEETPLEVWEAVVQIEETPAGLVDGKPGPGSIKYVPLNVRRKRVYGNTLSISDKSVLDVMLGNSSVPLGFESYDLGIARNAAP